MTGHSAPLRYWSILPAVPALIVAISAIGYRSGGPVFEIGGAYPGDSRGEETRLVYTSAGYEEATFRAWVEGLDAALPWLNVNTEHVAIVFTHDMDAIKWGRYREIESGDPVATYCLYEEDRSILGYTGFHDCFADRNTAEEDRLILLATESTGLGRDIDNWFATARLCDGVEVTGTVDQDIARTHICRSMISAYERRLTGFIEKYGENSDEVAFVRAQADARGFNRQ
jgi:hypothetical protein